jgi:hypothetical protein
MYQRMLMVQFRESFVSSMKAQDERDEKPD